MDLRAFDVPRYLSVLPPFNELSAAEFDNDEGQPGTCADVATVSLPVSKATVASRLSLTPEYFSRVLHELEGAGLIAIDKRDIRILDVKRLARYEVR